MKHLVSILFLATTLHVSSLARAADVESFIVAKGQQFRQTNAAAPVQVSDNGPFRFFSSVTPADSNTVTGVSLRLPNSQGRMLTNFEGEFQLEQAFTNKSLLDGAFGAGKYTFTIQTLSDGTRTPLLSLPADAYPPTPHIANWLDAQEIDSSLPFTLFWDPYTNGTANDFVSLDIEGTDTSYRTPGLLEEGALNGTNTAVVIPAGALAPRQEYKARLLFVKGTGMNKTNYPGAAGLAGFYKQTQFLLMTQPPATIEGRLEFKARTYSAAEGSGMAEITITRSGSHGAVSVNVITSDETAKDGLDYTGGSATLMFPDGVTSAIFSFPLLDDFLLEGNETINLSLSSPIGGAVLGSRSNAVFTILDNEIASAGRLQFSPVTYSVLESAPVANVTVTRTGGSTGAVSVNFHTVGGTALGAADYVSTNGTLAFAAGQVSRMIPIAIRNDAFDETNETFRVVLDSTTGGAAHGTNTMATVTIQDNDVGGVIAFSAATFSTNENAASIGVKVNRTGGTAGSVTVDFATQDGTALAGFDYFPINGTLAFGSNELSKVIFVSLMNDLVAEGDESFNFRLLNPTGGATLGAISNATLRIIDDESSVAFTNANYTVSEAGPSITINVVRSGALTTPVSMQYATADGTAISTNDYRGTNGMLTFAPGIKFKPITIPIVNDTIVEASENFTVSLFDPQGGVQLGALTATTVTITNNDQGGVIQFTATNYTALESVASAAITLSRTGGSASGVSVDFTTADGTATAGLDYSNATRTVFFNVNELTKTIQVPIINDGLDEPNETVLLSLSNPQGGASLGARSNAMLTIQDNDVAGAIAFSAATFSTNENAASIGLKVNRTGGTAGSVTVDFVTQDGTALAGFDYFPLNGTLAFGSNELSKVIFVSLMNDLVAEGAESFNLRLTNPTGGATLGAITNATLRIIDDESSVAFTNANYTVSESGPSVTVTVLRSGALTTTVSVKFASINGTAISPEDYRGTNGVLTFAPGMTSKTITIPIISDTLDEANETFSVMLFDPQGGVQLGTIANTTVTITDNDDAGVIQFSAATFSVTEATNKAAIKVTRAGGSASGVTVQFNVTIGGTATDGADFTALHTNLTFAAGETNKIVLIPILADGIMEPTETVNLILSNPTGGATLGAITAATLNIADAPDPNAIPATGADFMTFMIDGTRFTADAGRITGGYGALGLNVTGVKLSGTTTYTMLFQSVLVSAPGTYQIPMPTGGGVSYQKIVGALPPVFLFYTTADGRGSGTLIIDVLDTTAKVMTGRFDFILGNTLAAGPVHAVGSFRYHYP